MRICCAGEVMVEMAAQSQAGLYRQGVAGDSFNTAVYLARAGLPVDYLTRLGDDAFSGDIARSLAAEGIGTDLVQHCPGRSPGLYVISNDAQGERQFSYWREHSPARELFDQPLTLDACDLFYFTGITLAVARSGLHHLVDLLRDLRRRGCTVAYDPNYRPRLWRDRQQAREHNREILSLCDILLPTLEDETALWDTASIDACRDHYREYGIGEMVIKGPQLTAYAFASEARHEQQAERLRAVDTTGAGDSFNAGYLAARLQNRSPGEAIGAAQSLSAAVVQHHGAILPRRESGNSGKH